MRFIEEELSDTDVDAFGLAKVKGPACRASPQSDWQDSLPDYDGGLRPRAMERIMARNARLKRTI